MGRRVLARVACSSILCLAACGAGPLNGADDALFQADSAATSQQDGLAADSGFRNCLMRDFKPSRPAGFKFWRNTLKARSEPTHSVQDVIVPPGTDLTLHGHFAYSFLGLHIAGEKVEVFLNDCAGWRGVGQLTTDGAGTGTVQLSAATLHPGQFAIAEQVLGDASVAASTVHILPVGTHFVVFDVDGTLTAGDGELWRDLKSELYGRLGRKEYVPAARAAAAAVTRAWAAKGYMILYLTGRPWELRKLTMTWLESQGFAPGALHVTERRDELLPTVAGVGAYKAKYLRSLTGLGYALDYAYGNAPTDAYAYHDAGIAPAHSFFLGSEIDTEASQLLGDDYVAHLPTLDAMPNAAQPF